MRKIFLLCILFLSNTVSSQNYWLRQQTPTNYWLYRLDFVDSLYGWVVGDSGTILHTTNAGTNWIKQSSGIVNFIEDVDFINRRLGWAISNDYYFQGTIILKTTDGGENWTNYRYPDTTLIINTVSFLDSLTGFFAGFNGLFLKTTNAGVNWTRCDVDTGSFYLFPVEDISFYNSSFAIACGGVIDIAGIVWRTTNGGQRWNSSVVGAEPLYDTGFLDSLRAVTVGGDFEYGVSCSKTYNGGLNWDYNTTGIFGQGTAIAIRTPSEIWVPAGFSGRWIVSLDSGNTWMELFTPDSAAIYDAMFVNSRNGWACGAFGSVYKYNSNIIGVQNHNTIFPSENILYQNFPNPFNPSTKIKFYLTQTAHVRLTVYDLLGKVVRVILNERRSAGLNTVDLNLTNLSSGVYYYKIESRNFSETKRMVLIR